MKSVHSELTALCSASANGDKLFFHFVKKSGLETPRLDSNQRRFREEGGLGQHSRTDAFLALGDKHRGA